MGIGIVKITREFTEPLGSWQDYHKKVIRIIDEFNEEQFPDIYFRGNALIIDFKEYNNYYAASKQTEIYEDDETSSYPNTQFTGLQIPENTTFIKILTLEFSDGTIAKFNCRTEHNKLYKSLKNYIDSEFTDVPGELKSELERAAELLADDEFDDI